MHLEIQGEIMMENSQRGHLEGVGALCIHGFGSMPFEMEGVASALAALGCETSVPLLPGHGETPKAWDRSGFADWAGAVEREYDALLRRNDRVVVCGLSMGGLLSLHLGAVRKPAAVAAVAAPVYLYRFVPLEVSDWRLPFLPLLRGVRPLWPVPPASPESRRTAPWKGYEGVVALNALSSLMDGMRSTRSKLHRLTAPIMTIHSPRDRTVPMSSSYTILAEVGSAVRRMEILPIENDPHTGHHVLTTHKQTAPRVEQLVCSFFLEQLAPSE